MRWMPDTQELIRTALQSLTGFFHDCCTAADKHKRKTASLLAYWLRDYVRFLRKEGEARIYKRFQRGDIVKVHLGYRVGSEEGGLHYAVVVSSTDSVKSPTLVVIPLMSKALTFPTMCNKIYLHKLHSEQANRPQDTRPSRATGTESSA